MIEIRSILKTQMTYEDLNIIYEDNHIIAVVKEQGVPMCPDETGDVSLYDLVKQYRVNNEKKP
ncbi:MAG: hypothetical protein LBN25_00920, partial [Christensenellaceae bacterium]|nr:hypothetical protein [Christensenellaceae bacterium]